ncbi:hypothetical protein T492DRAFT_291767 [Pavlovales sp. CCMP2436]|nr:hypothetical protein T492DRAFT_291767 [Pavlovales sp. CCMP2436]
MMYSSREQTYARQECTRGGGNTPGPRVAGPGRVGTRRGGTGARGGYIFLGVPVDSFGALVLAAGELRAEERASLPVSAVTPGMAEKPTHVAHTGRNTHASLRTGLANRGPTYLTPHTSLILFQRVLVESAGAAPRFEQALPPRDRLLSASGRQAVGDGVGTCPSVPTRRRSAHFLRPLPGEGAVLLTPPPMSLAAAEVCSTRLAAVVIIIYLFIILIHRERGVILILLLLLSVLLLLLLLIISGSAVCNRRLAFTHRRDRADIDTECDRTSNTEDGWGGVQHEARC